MTYVIETRGLTRWFGRGRNRRKAVDRINMHVGRGEIYGLLGPNGAGKSTTLKMLTGMLRPSRGSILFQGHPWTREDLYRIGALIESPPLYPNLTARENLQVRATLLGLDPSTMDRALRTVGLIDTGNKQAGRFSMGMKQRLGIALSLLSDPELLILDEPTNGLDPMGIEDLRVLIRTLAAEGTTVIVSSHILSEISQVADHIGIIAQGRLVYEHSLDHSVDLEELFMRECRRVSAEAGAR